MHPSKGNIIMELWTPMRRVLSLFAGYDPPPHVVGGPAMETVVEAVLDESIDGLGRKEVLMMCQDLDEPLLMHHILDYMWKEGNGKRLR